MRKQKIQMIVLLVVLAALVAGGFAARKISSREEEEAKKKEEGEYSALSFDGSLLARLEVASDKGTLILDCNEGAWSFVKDIAVEEQESVEDSTETAAYEVNSSEADELLDKIANLTSANKIENVTDRKEYGLDQPVMTITATLSDGTEHCVEVGLENSMISARYICVDDTDTIYTMSEGDYNLFRKTDTDLAQEKS